MRFHVLTLFPKMFEGPFSEGVIKRGRDSGVIQINIHNIRDYTHDPHRKVDDYPFGGGPGMLMKPEPVFKAVETLKHSDELEESLPIILLSPQGRKFTQTTAAKLAHCRELLLICGRYEGVDERIRTHLATEEISVGDYILSGGELAAMVLIEAVSRMVPGVLGSINSSDDDSFMKGLLQHPQYTRPAQYREWTVPNVLLSGNHAEIERWRRRESLRRTFQRRPDLLETLHLSFEDRCFIESLHGCE